ncbi:hypothetical protein [Luteolibacter sp. AS25]|uniref:hypothetical protein n=1 Tax=Luteolibacter sp. AS25 TaxID=3135776 RepID=UPI00398B58D1
MNHAPNIGGGLRGGLMLPADASPRSVAKLAIGADGMGFALPKRPLVYVHCSKSVKLANDFGRIYTALHCYSTRGEKMVLMRYLGDGDGWDARVTDAKLVREVMKNGLVDPQEW